MTIAFSPACATRKLCRAVEVGGKLFYIAVRFYVGQMSQFEESRFEQDEKKSCRTQYDLVST
ncbi:hypothetical protein HUU05_04545 [candidate division KSB1 bacterium]|nr:hypothetical protein [candidate division KSB1 bacterium]